MEQRNFSVIFWTFWKIRVFNYDYHIMLITYINTRFDSIETISDFGTKFAQNYMNDKTFTKINLKIVISI